MASGTQVYFQSKGVTNVKNLYEQIHQHTHEDAPIDYLKTKNHWTSADFASVDWSSHEIAFNSLTYCEQIGTTKAMHRWIPVNTRLHKFNKSTHSTDKCPMCNKAEETTNHLYSCQHFTSKNVRKQQMEKLKQLRKTSQISPHVFNPFIKHLYAILQQKPLSPPACTRTSPIGKLIDEALQEQYKIGRMQALQGRISGKWREAEAATKVHSYNQDITGIFPAFIRMLWKTSKAIWLARNELQHGATPEARLKKKQLQLKAEITFLYSQQSTVSFINTARLFKMRLATRLKRHPDKNKRWIAIIRSAQQLKTRQEEYLLSRIPKLTTFKGYTRKEAPPQESESSESEEESLGATPLYKQQSLHAYIEIKKYTGIQPQNALGQGLKSTKQQLSIYTALAIMLLFSHH